MSSTGRVTAASGPGSLWVPTLQVALAVSVLGALLARNGGGAGFVVFFLCGVAGVGTLYAAVRGVSALRDPTLERPLVSEDSRAALEHEKRLALMGLRELEADIAAGKVDPSDAEPLKASAEQRALEIIHRLREDESRWLQEAQNLVKDRGLKGAEDGALPTVEASVPARPTAPTPEGSAAAVAVFPNDEAHILEDACSACRTPVVPGASFCSGCGRRLKGAAA